VIAVNLLPARYHIVHETIYSYESPVSLSRQLLHLTPRDCAWQRCLAHQITVDPTVTAVRERLDDDVLLGGGDEVAHERVARSEAVGVDEDDDRAQVDGRGQPLGAEEVDEGGGTGEGLEVEEDDALEGEFFGFHGFGDLIILFVVFDIWTISSFEYLEWLSFVFSFVDVCICYKFLSSFDESGSSFLVYSEYIVTSFFIQRRIDRSSFDIWTKLP